MKVKTTGKFASIGLVSWDIPGKSRVQGITAQRLSGGVPKSRWCRFQRRDAQCLIAENLGEWQPWKW